MSAVYVVLYNARTLWHTIGLIGVVMACYGRKSRFADEPQALHIIGMLNFLKYWSNCLK